MKKNLLTRKARRSLAASKANATRKARKSALDSISNEGLQYELVRRAWERGQETIARTEAALVALHAKQCARQREMARCAERAIRKGGAS